MNEYEQALQAVRDIYVTYPKRIESNEEELKKIDQEIQDLLHVIELGTFDAAKGSQILKQLKKARQERRRVKNDLELLEPIKEFISYAKPSEKNIGQSIGKLRNECARTSNLQNESKNGFTRYGEVNEQKKKKKK